MPEQGPLRGPTFPECPNRSCGVGLKHEAASTGRRRTSGPPYSIDRDPQFLVVDVRLPRGSAQATADRYAPSGGIKGRIKIGSKLVLHPTGRSGRGAQFAAACTRASTLFPEPRACTLPPYPRLLASVCTSTSATGRLRSDRTRGTRAIAMRSSRKTLGHNLALRLPHFWAKEYTAAKVASARR